MFCSSRDIDLWIETASQLVSQSDIAYYRQIDLVEQMTGHGWDTKRAEWLAGVLKASLNRRIAWLRRLHKMDRAKPSPYLARAGLIASH